MTSSAYPSSAVRLTSEPRILHQSITDLHALPQYRVALEKSARGFLAGRAEVVVRGVRAGTYPHGVQPIVALRSAWTHHLLETQVIRGVLDAAEQGVDAVTISCFFDPGVMVLRAELDIPVVPACETAILAASSDGGPCALVTLDEAQRRWIEALVKRYGFEDRVVWVRALSPAVTEDELDRPRAGAALVERLTVIAAQAASDGATSFVAAEGALNSLLARSGVHELAGLLLVDSTEALMRRALAEMARLAAATGSGSDGTVEQWEHFEAVTAAALSERCSTS